MNVQSIKRSYRSCTGYFASLKNKKQIIFASTLERKFFLLLEFDDDVVSYVEQPFKLYYELDEKKTRYTPDVQVVLYKDGSQVVYEVKYQDEIDSDPDLQYKLVVLEEAIRQQKSLPFKVFTDTQIDETYLDNCRFLYQFRNTIPNDQLLIQLKHFIEQNTSSISIQEVIEATTSEKMQRLVAIQQLWYLIFKNRDWIDMKKKLTMATIIQAKGALWLK